MDNCPNYNNNNTLNNKEIIYKYRKSQKLSQYCSENKDEPNDILNRDENTLNLFKGIVKITTKPNKSNMELPIIKYNSADNTNNIFAFTNKLFNNEEHLNSNKNFTIKIPENISPKPSPKRNGFLSIDYFPKAQLKKARSTRQIVEVSKEEEENGLKKSLVKKSPRQLSTVSLRKKGKKNDYSFFQKLKVKDKNPSKTPYLDKKCWNSTYSLKKYDFSGNPKINIINKKNQSNLSLVAIPKDIKSKLGDKDNNLEKNNTDKENTFKKALTYKKEKDNKENNETDNEKAVIAVDNKNNINNKNEINNEIKNEINNAINNKLNNTDNNPVNENKIIFVNKKESKNKKPNNIIFNFLNKPFFCCFKS